MTIIDSYSVPKEKAGRYLYDVAYEAFFKIIPSRKGIKKAIQRKSVLVDGEVGSTGWKLRAHQKIDLLENYTKIPKSYDLGIKVLFEDEQYAVLHKPHGLITSGNQYKNLYNTLGYNLQKSNAIDALPYPTPCHRLDAETAGCILIAKTKTAQIKINQLFSERKIYKTYTAIVHGEIPIKGSIHLPINGQTASTKFVRVKVIVSRRDQTYSVVNMYPITGRTHQLRIHFSMLGHPILGDKKYGNAGNILKHKGLFLCSTALDIEFGLLAKHISTSPSKKFQRFENLISA